MSKPDFEYAGFLDRLAATVIDTVILLVLTLPPLVGIYGWEYFESEKFFVGYADFLISWVLPAIAVIVLWMKWQATPGKAVLSLRVVDADSGESLTVGQSIGRYLGYFVASIPFFLGFLWLCWDKKSQGWHDKMANTVVIRATGRGA